MAKSDTKWEDVADGFAPPWKDYNEGDTLEGEYLGTRMFEGDRGEFTSYTIKQDNGEALGVSGATLKARMTRIPIGTRVKITFLGTQPSKSGTDMKMFAVQTPPGTKLLPMSEAATA